MKKKLLALFTTAFLLCSCGVAVPSGDASNSSFSFSGGGGGGTDYSEDESEEEEEELEGDSSEETPTVNKWAIKNPDTKYHPIRESEEDIEYTDFFNLHNKVDIKIEIDDVELGKLSNDLGGSMKLKCEIYRLAKKVTIGITYDEDHQYSFEYENVGIRQKGNTSRNYIYDDYGGLNYNHFKLSFDETFTNVDHYGQEFVDENGNESYSKRDFFGLSGLDIKWNRNNDMTHLKEIYASYLYQANGIIHQHVGLTEFAIRQCGTNSNRDYNFGLCFLYEPASKSYVKNALSSGDYYMNMASWDEEKKGEYGVEGEKYGDLYKVTYGKNCDYGKGGDLTSASLTYNGYQVAAGIKDDDYGYRYPIYERKTSKKAEYDERQLVSLINVLNDKNKGYSDIAKLVDLEYLAKEEAVAFFVGNPDSFRYNYNNYQMYFRRTDGKMVILPIDDDRAFGIGETWRDGLYFVADSYLSPLSPITVNGRDNRNPLLDKTILSSTKNACQQAFVTHLNRIRNSKWVSSSTFEAFMEVASKTYENYDFVDERNGDNIAFSQFIDIKIDAADEAIVSYNKSSEPSNPSGGHGGSSGSNSESYSTPTSTYYTSEPSSTSYWSDSSGDWSGGSEPSSSSEDYNESYMLAIGDDWYPMSEYPLDWAQHGQLGAWRLIGVDANKGDSLEFYSTEHGCLYTYPEGDSQNPNNIKESYPSSYENDLYHIDASGTVNIYLHYWDSGSFTFYVSYPEGSASAPSVHSEFFGSYIDRLYFVGPFNNWGRYSDDVYASGDDDFFAQYHLTLNPNNENYLYGRLYIYPENITNEDSLNGNYYFDFKINGGPDGWSPINYGSASNTNQLYNQVDTHIRTYVGSSCPSNYLTVDVFVNIHDGYYEISFY